MPSVVEREYGEIPGRIGATVIGPVDDGDDVVVAGIEQDVFGLEIAVAPDGRRVLERREIVVERPANPGCGFGIEGEVADATIEGVLDQDADECRPGLGCESEAAADEVVVLGLRAVHGPEHVAGSAPRGLGRALVERGAGDESHREAIVVVGDDRRHGNAGGFGSKLTGDLACQSAAVGIDLDDEEFAGDGDAVRAVIRPFDKRFDLVGRPPEQPADGPRRRRKNHDLSPNRTAAFCVTAIRRKIRRNELTRVLETSSRRFFGRFVGTASPGRTPSDREDSSEDSSERPIVAGVPDPRPPEKPDERRESDETELEEAARQESEYPADETNEG